MSAPVNALPPYPDDQRGTSTEALRAELLGVIGTAIKAHPRSQQRRIGPSELGTPCVRRLGHKLAGTPEVNAGGDGWKATIGTAVHAWLADVMVAANVPERAVLAEALGVLGAEPVPGQPSPQLDELPTRWLVEQRVHAGSIDGQTHDGSCDLFDRATGTVVDWKVTSLANLKGYRSKGPGDQYRVQAHTYGLGWLNRGEQVHTVAVCFLPRDGDLRQAHLWAEPFDAQVARDALARADALAAGLRIGGAAALLPQLPTAPAYCRWCPFYSAARAVDLTRACPGHGAGGQAPGGDTLAGLV